MTVREMTFDDIDEVIRIENENFPISEVWSDTGFATHLFRSDTLYLVAEDESGIHGYAGLLMVPDESDITKISVEKAMMRQGIGSMLLDALIDLASMHGINKIYLEVRKSNKPARLMYEKAGFSETGMRKDYYAEPIEDAILMEYKIEEEKDA